jgi:hypothetical protein
MSRVLAEAGGNIKIVMARSRCIFCLGWFCNTMGTRMTRIKRIYTDFWLLLLDFGSGIKKNPCRFAQSASSVFPLYRKTIKREVYNVWRVLNPPNVVIKTLILKRRRDCHLDDVVF